ncbi:MAG: RHS repeat-associated core domain-containing protein, partial [Steroidobacteraceae bacterium]
MTTGWAGAMGVGQALTINTTASDRGYTGQEALDAVQLDDYNARLYDPRLGRFLSVDPLIGHPESTQGINPYSYVENNPLNRTDPTGEADTTCTGTGDNRVCTSTTTVTNTPTGSHIPQQTNVTTTSVGGKVTNVSTSGPGSVPGGGIAMSTDDNSVMRISVSGSAVGQGTKSSNAQNNTNTHDIKNNLPQSDVVSKGDGVPKNGWKASDSNDPHKQEKAIDGPAQAGLSVAEKLTEQSGHEYAGAVVQSPDGRLYYTSPVRGQEGQFSMSVGLPNDWRLVAIFHTHPAAMNDQHGFSAPDIVEIGALRGNALAQHAITYVGTPNRDVIVYNPAFDHPLGQFQAQQLGLQAGGATGRIVCSHCLP